MLQPVSHRLVQQPAGSTCWQGKALQEGETFQPVAAALWGWDVASPHHSRPAELSAPATGRRGRQCPLWTGCQLPQGSGGRTTVTQDGFKYPWSQGWRGMMKEIWAGGLPANILAMIVSQEDAKNSFIHRQDAALFSCCKCEKSVYIQLGKKRQNVPRQGVECSVQILNFAADLVKLLFCNEEKLRGVREESSRSWQIFFFFSRKFNVFQLLGNFFGNL